jgi:hypothetical protein
MNAVTPVFRGVCRRTRLGLPAKRPVLSLRAEIPDPGHLLKCVHKVHIYTFSRFGNSAIPRYTERDAAGNAQRSKVN